MSRSNHRVIASCLFVVSMLIFAANAQAQTSPDFISASDGTYTGFVRLSWMPSTNGPLPDGYFIYRHTSNISSASTVVLSWISPTNMSADDTTVVSNRVYYYWIRGFLFDGSNLFFGSYSAPDTGYAQPTSSPPSSSLVCTSPNGGETVSGVATLRWTCVGSASSDVVRIEYSGNGGSSWVSLTSSVPAAVRSCVWDSRSVANTTLALWRVVSLIMSNVWDTSDGPFTVNNAATYLADQSGIGTHNLSGGTYTQAGGTTYLIATRGTGTLNLDGGSSSCLWIRGAPGGPVLRNAWKPVRNYLAIVPK